MVDLYLRFADLHEASATLGAIGVQLGEGGSMPVDGTTGGMDFALDLVFGSGIIMLPTGQSVDTPTGPANVMQPLPGCHLNLRWRAVSAPAVLTPYLVQPQTPALLWA
jgi:hypothetical protein